MNGEPPRGHRLVAHTADVIVEAWAPSREACVEEAILGVVDVFARGGDAAESRGVVVDADDPIPRLVDVVLTLVDADGLVPTAVTVHEPGDGTLHARFELARLARIEVVGPVPKAVARQGSRPERFGDSWRCGFVVDV